MASSHHGGGVAYATSNLSMQFNTVPASSTMGGPSYVLDSMHHSTIPPTSNPYNTNIPVQGPINTNNFPDRSPMNPNHLPIQSPMTPSNLTTQNPASLGKSVRTSSRQSYILMSPIFGPKSVLLSPLYDNTDSSGQQSRFVILPMDVMEGAGTPRSSFHSPLLAIQDFTDAEVQDTLRGQEQRREGYTGSHRRQDPHTARAPHNPPHSPAQPSSLSLQPNNLGSAGRAVDNLGNSGRGFDNVSSSGRGFDNLSSSGRGFDNLSTSGRGFDNLGSSGRGFGQGRDQLGDPLYNSKVNSPFESKVHVCESIFHNSTGPFTKFQSYSRGTCPG